MSKGSVLLAGLRNISKLPMPSGIAPSNSLLLRLRYRKLLPASCDLVGGAIKAISGMGRPLGGPAGFTGTALLLPLLGRVVGEEGVAGGVGSTAGAAVLGGSSAGVSSSSSSSGVSGGVVVVLVVVGVVGRVVGVAGVVVGAVVGLVVGVDVGRGSAAAAAAAAGVGSSSGSTASGVVVVVVGAVVGPADAMDTNTQHMLSWSVLIDSRWLVCLCTAGAMRMSGHSSDRPWCSSTSSGAMSPTCLAFKKRDRWQGCFHGSRLYRLDPLSK